MSSNINLDFELNIIGLRYRFNLNGDKFNKLLDLISLDLIVSLEVLKIL